MKKLLVSIILLQFVILLVSACVPANAPTDSPAYGSTVTTQSEESVILPKPGADGTAVSEGKTGEDVAAEPDSAPPKVKIEDEPEDDLVLELKPLTSHEPYPEPDKWTVDEIIKFCEETGRISNMFYFTFRDTDKVVKEEKGDNYDPELTVLYTSERVVGCVELNVGAEWFGMRVGKSTLDEVIAQLERDDLPIYYTDEGEMNEEPPSGGYRHIFFELFHESVGGALLFFADDILQEIFLS